MMRVLGGQAERLSAEQAVSLLEDPKQNGLCLEALA